MAKYDQWGGPMGAARASKGILGQDVERMQKGELGLSEGEQRSMTDKALQQANRQVAQQQKNINRQAMAAGGTGNQFTGQAAALSRDLAEQSAEAGAKAAQQASELSVQLAEQRAADTRQRLERQQDRARQNVMNGINVAMNTAQLAMGFGATDVGKGIGQAFTKAAEKVANRMGVGGATDGKPQYGTKTGALTNEPSDVTGTEGLLNTAVEGISAAAPALMGMIAPGVGGHIAQQAVRAPGILGDMAKSSAHSRQMTARELTPEQQELLYRRTGRNPGSNAVLTPEEMQILMAAEQGLGNAMDAARNFIGGGY